MFSFLVLMERLVNELGSLLKMLDHETVSPATADKMASVRNILDSLPGTESCIMHRIHTAVPKMSMEALVPFLIYKPFWGFIDVSLSPYCSRGIIQVSTRLGSPI